jgi:hypothetical protein
MEKKPNFLLKYLSLSLIALEHSLLKRKEHSLSKRNSSSINKISLTYVDKKKKKLRFFGVRKSTGSTLG